MTSPISGSIMSEISYNNVLEECRRLGDELIDELEHLTDIDDDMMNKCDKTINKMISIYESLKNNKVNNSQDISLVNAQIHLTQARCKELKISSLKGIGMSGRAIAQDLYNIVKSYYVYFVYMISKKCRNPRQLTQRDLQFYNYAIDICSSYVEVLKKCFNENVRDKDKANRSKMYLEKMKNLCGNLIDISNQFETDFPKLTQHKDSEVNTDWRDSESMAEFRHGRRKIKFKSQASSDPLFCINRLQHYKL